jgi:hypothetical protein
LNCLVECRKAFFVTFESDYDTHKDLVAEFELFGSSAPYYARDKKYIKKHVKMPFDYIVLDHSGLDAQLMKEGIENTDFWNVWRLTPQVYRFKDDADWLVKNEPAKQETEGINERAGYVLSSVISMLLARQTSRSMMKSLSGSRYELKLKSSGLNVYEKADKAGPVAGKVPDGVEIITVEYSTRGLNDEEIYWYVFYFRKEPLLMLMGYMLESDLVFE